MTLFPITKEMVAIFDSYYCHTPETLQEVLFRLKEIGVSQMQCVRLLIDKLNIRLRDADIIVLNSNAWSKEKDANESFRRAFWELVESKQNDQGRIPL